MMTFILILSANILVWCLGYFWMKSKITKALSLKEVEDRLNELVSAFNRNADINLRCLEEREGSVARLLASATDISKKLKEYQEGVGAKLAQEKKSFTHDVVANSPLISKVNSEKKNKKIPNSHFVTVSNLPTTKVNNEKKKSQKGPVKLKTDREKITYFAHQGLSQEKISKKLNLPLSEVRLLVSLEKEKMIQNSERKKKLLKKSLVV